MPNNGIAGCYKTCNFQVLLHYGQSPVDTLYTIRPRSVAAIRPPFIALGSIFQVLRVNFCVLLVGFKMCPKLAPTSLANAQQIEAFIASLPLEQANRQTLIELLSSQIDSHNLESQAKIGQHISSKNLSFSEETTRVNLACKISQAVFTGEKQYTDSATNTEYYTERIRVNW